MTLERIKCICNGRYVFNNPFALLCMFLFCFLSFGYTESSEMNICIERKMRGDQCTMGYLLVNDNVLCYTLELPWLWNLQEVSCIPEGEYKGYLRYDKNDKWRIQLEGVPNREAVQIHVGNYTTETKGCVLIGTGASVEDCMVTGSSVAYSNFKEAFYGTKNPNSTPNKRITIKIK